MSKNEQNQETISNSSTRRTSLEIPYLDESIFNSKIFFHLDRITEDSLNNSLTEEYENSSESEKNISEEISTDYFLISDLLDKIDHPCLNTPKNFDEKLNFEEKNLKEENLKKNSVPLVNKGYSYIPKSYKLKEKNIKENVSKKEINQNDFSNIKKKNFHEREGDWVCGFCNNLNFSFRNKCNRCKASKEESIKTN